MPEALAAAQYATDESNNYTLEHIMFAAPYVTMSVAHFYQSTKKEMP